MSSSNRESGVSNQGSVPEDSHADVMTAVEDLLNSLSNRFAGVSSEIFAKMDEMSRRLDNLEATLLESKNKCKDGGSGPSKS